MENTCPACYKNNLEMPLVRNALSRRDNKTYICNECGDKEAWADMAKYKKDQPRNREVEA